MGQVSTEQTVRIIEAVGEAVQQPASSEPHWAFSLVLVLAPVALAAYLGVWTRNVVIKRKRELKK